MTPAARPGGRDRGLSLIEVLVAVSLLGLAVAGTLPALWASARGSALQSDIAGARRWIVAAGDHAVSPGVARISCAAAPPESIRASYETAIRAVAADERPAGWGDAQLRVTEVQFFDGTTFSASACVDTPTRPVPLQLIVLQVARPDGNVLETLRVVKS